VPTISVAVVWDGYPLPLWLRLQGSWAQRISTAALPRSHLPTIALPHKWGQGHTPVPLPSTFFLRMIRTRRSSATALLQLY
jgi:hypothetical protein